MSYRCRTKNFLDSIQTHVNNVREFEEYLDTLCLDQETSYDLPECMQFDSLVFALNNVEWEIMWSLERKKKAVDSEARKED